MDVKRTLSSIELGITWQLEVSLLAREALLKPVSSTRERAEPK